MPGFLVCILAFLSFANDLHAGLTELFILTSPEGNRVIVLGGDNHEIEPETQTERLLNAIAECQKKSPTPLKVYIERPAGIIKVWNDACGTEKPILLADIIEKLKAADISEVSVEDCEVRNVTLLASWLFGQKYPHGTSESVVVDTRDKVCKSGTATIANLFAEYKALSTSLQSFSDSLEGSEQAYFQMNLKKAEVHMNCFLSSLKPYMAESYNLLKTAIKVADQDLDHGTNVQEGIMYHLMHSTCRLFDLNLIREILISSNIRKVLILAGGNHTTSLKNFLLSSQWKISQMAGSHQITNDTDPEKISFEPISNLDLSLMH